MLWISFYLVNNTFLVLFKLCVESWEWIYPKILKDVHGCVLYTLKLKITMSCVGVNLPHKTAKQSWSVYSL